MLLIKGLIGGLFQVLIFGALLLVPAGLVPGGSWYWERAIWFLIAYGISVETLTVWLYFKAPKGLAARFKKAPKDEKRPKEDKIFLPVFIILFLVFFLIIPLDVFYFHFFPAPGLAWSIAGAVLALMGLIFNAGSIYANAFITKTIQDQTDEGQTVADTGVYAIVRHPMYASFIPLFGGGAIWLESWAGVIALVPLMAIFVVRIGIEERTLHETLPGYTEYTQKVKYRLIPGVW